MVWYKPGTWFKSKPKESATVTTQPAQRMGAISTDFTSGESVTTKTSEGKVTSQTYNPAPTTTNTTKSSGGSSRGGSVGKQDALNFANRPGGLVESSLQQTTPTEQTTTVKYNPGNTLKPATSNVVTSATPGAPERYDRPLTSALKDFGNKINPLSSKNTYGLIGTQGFSAWSQETFFKPFEYVGKPKAYDKVGYNINPSWRGTNFGGSEYTPSEYKDTTNLTYFEVSEQKTKDVFIESGVIYTGTQNIKLLPSYIGESLVNDQSIKNKYQSQVTETTTQAELDVINTNYQAEINKLYSERVGRATGRANEIIRFNADIFEPKAYSTIRTVGTVAETGALIGATAFGGSGLTFAASAYMGVKTARQSMAFSANYDQLTPTQKVLGYGNLAIGTAATIGTFNLGVSKFYSEWRNIIYTDLVNAPGKIRGAEIAKVDGVTTFDVTTTKQSGVNTALTAQRIDVMQTGTDRIAFIGKGKNVIKIFDPQTEKFLTSTNTFKTSGFVPNIKTGGVSIVSNGIKVTSEQSVSGVGRAFYITDTSLKQYSYVAASTEQPGYYNVLNAKNLKVKGSYGAADFDASGIITKLPSNDFTFSNLVVGSGRKSSQDFINSLYNAGAASAVQTANKAQNIAITSLTTSTSKTGAATIINANYKTSTTTIQSLTPSVKSVTQTKTTSATPLAIFDTPTITDTVVRSSGSSLSLGTVQLQAPAQTQKQQETLINTPIKTSVGIPRGNYGIPAFTTPFLFMPPISFTSGFSDDASSRILTGGKRKTGYIPSYSAIIFKQFGKYKGGALSKSGLDYRPITKSFNISRRAGGFKLRI